MSLYKFIDYPRMIYEALRNDLSVTKVYYENGVQKGGELSLLYRFLLACLYTLQPIWNDFETWRIRKLKIANCKYSIGQLTNLLNYYFDNEQKRIYIDQIRILTIYAPNINEESVTFAYDITEDIVPVSFAPNINDSITVINDVIFYVPNEIYTDELIMNEIESTIQQINIEGINYTIQPIII